MHTYHIAKGTTNVSIELRIVDSTDGTPETGVVWNTAGIALEYRRDGAASTAITEATLAALTTAHTDGGFLHIGNGVYRFDLPDAACASGVDKVVVHGTVTGMVVIGCVIQLTDVDLFDGVRAGLTALPNAAADAAGGLPISDAGGLDLDTKLANANEITAARMGALTDWINGGRLDLLLDAIKVVTDAQTAISPAALVDLVWDEVISSTAHATATSAGNRVYLGQTNSWISSSVNDATASTTAFITNLTSSVDNFYNDQSVFFVTGALAGQSRIISAYNGTTKAITVDEAFTSAPADTTVFGLGSLHVHSISQTQAGLATEAKQDAQDAIITEARLAELDAANLPANIDAILTDTASIGITKNATFSNLEFLMVDATDHVTPETGLTVTGTMSIDGAAFAAVNGAITEVGSGIYQIDLTAADTNGDVITYKFSSAGAADRFITIKTRA